MMLSLPDDWNYTTRGLAAICKEGVDSIGNALRELEASGYIIRNRIRGNNGRIADTEYIIYEKPREKSNEVNVKLPDITLPDTSPPCTENPYLDISDTENPIQLNTNLTIIKESNKDQLSTPSFFPSNEEKDGKKELLALREQIKEQIGYEYIVTMYNKGRIDEFIELMMEVALSKGAAIRLGRDAEYPTAFVQERFRQLQSSHIEKVLEAMKENTTRVWNTKAYLMMALFNAPSSIDNHYAMLVNHDMHGMI